MKNSKFVEIIELESNHIFVVGTVGKGKTNEFLEQLQCEHQNDIPKPLLGEKVIPSDSLNLNVVCGD